MKELTLTALEEAFNSGEAEVAKYFAVAVTIPGIEGIEMIVNQKQNFQEKLAYYKQAYNEDLTHKHAPGIAIVNYCFAYAMCDVPFFLGLHDL